MTFPGKGFKSGHPVLCNDCTDVAIYKGKTMKNGFLSYLYYCALHGATAVSERVVSSIEEFNEYKAWLAKNKQEAQKAHPSSPIVSLFDGT